MRITKKAGRWGHGRGLHPRPPTTSSASPAPAQRDLMAFALKSYVLDLRGLQYGHNEYVLGPGLSPLVRARGRGRGRVWAPPPPLTPPPAGIGQHARHRQTCYPGAQLTCTTERAASYASESRECGSAGECGTHEQHASRLRYCE